jgi:hypothetical protein
MLRLVNMPIYERCYDKDGTASYALMTTSSSRITVLPLGTPVHEAIGLQTGSFCTSVKV